VTILYRLEGEPQAGSNNPYADVATGQWYTSAVLWADANGIVNGYGDGSFRPGRSITREQFAAILMRYAAFKGRDTAARSDLSVYTDASDVSGWALENVRWANAEELITGRSETVLAPSEPATRAEAAAIIMRFCENV
jgi:hypothetical protein